MKDINVLKAENASLQDERESLLRLQAVLISQLSTATGDSADEVK